MVSVNVHFSLVICVEVSVCNVFLCLCCHYSNKSDKIPIVWFIVQIDSLKVSRLVLCFMQFSIHLIY